MESIREAAIKHNRELQQAENELIAIISDYQSGERIKDRSLIDCLYLCVQTVEIAKSWCSSLQSKCSNIPIVAREVAKISQRCDELARRILDIEREKGIENLDKTFSDKTLREVEECLTLGPKMPQMDKREEFLTNINSNFTEV